MSTQGNATGGQIAGREPRPEITAELLTVGDVARLLRCSIRHVYRLADSGAMPRPVRLGQLVRWSRPAVSDWIAAGCPAVRRGGKR